MSRIADLVSTSNDLEFEDFPVKQWGGVTIRLKSMDVAHRGAYLERLIAARENEDSAALAQVQCELLVQSAYDPEDGSQAFTMDDIPMLKTKHGGVVGYLALKAQRLSGLDADAEERLGKDFSDSQETPSDDTSSTSPAS